MLLMPVIIKLPKPKRTELVNHLLTEQSGVGALDAYQGAVLDNKIIELRNYVGEIFYLTLEGNTNTFYPCIFPCSQKETVIEIDRNVHTDRIGAGALRSKFHFGTASWGSYPNFKYTEYCIQPTQTFIAAVEQYKDQVSNPIFYLRGGCSYVVYTNNTILPKVMICYEKTDIGREGYPFYVEPRTTVGEEFQSSTLPIQKQLATPLQGKVLTNNIPPRVNTRVNQLTLQPGTYLITSHVAYKESFSQFVVHWLLNGDGGQLVINRGTADGGGGTTPVMIYQATKSISIYSCVYQSSNSDRTIDRNTLTALRMA